MFYKKKVISYKHKRRPTDRVTTLIDTTKMYPLCSVRGVPNYHTLYDRIFVIISIEGRFTHKNWLDSHQH